MATDVKKTNLGMIMAVYLFGIFMGAIDTGIVTPARTIIQNNLGVDAKAGIWIITIYTLAYAASIPVMGKLADRFGRKYIYLLSITLFGLGSLFAGMSENFGSFTLMLAARTIQAIGGGGIIPVATAEFGTTFPPEKRGMALGLIGGVFGVANIFGSSAGSAILDLFGKDNWQFIFYINLPICLFIIIAGSLFLPNNKTESVKKIDKFGIVLVVGMVLSLLYGLKNIDFFNFQETLSSTKVYPFLLIFLVLIPLFIIAEKKADDPVINLSYFTNKQIVITMILSFISGLVMMGMVFVPQFSENAMKISTGSGGYFVIILGLFAGVGAPFSGRLIDKFGVKIILFFGFLMSILGSLFLIFVTINHPNFFTVGVCLVLTGLGIGFTMGTPINYMMMANTREEDSNSALATVSLVRSIGTSIAPAIMVGFLAHAGMSVQGNIISLLPKEVSVPPLPYAQELTEKINALKADPNMKDKLANVSFPDLTSMTTVKINMDSNSGYKMPNDLLELMQSADVTNITDRSKILADRMFGQMTPTVISNIQAGVQKGIDSVTSGKADLEKQINDLKSKIEVMKSSPTGMPTGNGMPSNIPTGNIPAGQMPSTGGVNPAVVQLTAAVTKMEAAKADMDDTINKMNTLKNAVPSSFEVGKQNYSAEIEKLRPQLENEFQSTLNGGFKEVYLTTVISALIALLFLLFYSNNVSKKEEDSLEIEKYEKNDLSEEM